MYRSASLNQYNLKVLVGLFALAFALLVAPLGASAAPIAGTAAPVTNLSAATRMGGLKLTVVNGSSSSVIRGIAGASVSIKDSSGNEVAKSITDRYGRAILELPEGIYAAHVTASGFQDRDVSVIPVKAGKDFSLTIPLKLSDHDIPAY